MQVKTLHQPTTLILNVYKVAGSLFSLIERKDGYCKSSPPVFKEITMKVGIYMSTCANNLHQYINTISFHIYLNCSTLYTGLKYEEYYTCAFDAKLAPKTRFTNCLILFLSIFRCSKMRENVRTCAKMRRIVGKC